MTYNQRERFIPFYVDRVPHYIDKLTNNVLSEDQFIKLTTANQEKDKQKGYEDRMAGYYDKWYRYNRLDEGKAYDEGQRQAIEESEGDSLPAMVIIPCLH